MSLLLWVATTIVGSHRVCQNACRRENVVAMPGGHVASQNDLEICVASTQDQSILQIPKGMLVNLTYNWQGEKVLSVI